jgi:hypothetical protein
MSTKYQHRGVTPSSATASALRTMITELGDWETSRRYGHSRLTIARIAAGLPINPVTLTDVETRLAADAARRAADSQHVG